MDSHFWRDVAEQLAEVLEDQGRDNRLPAECPYVYTGETWERPGGCPEECGDPECGIMRSPLRCWLLWARTRVVKGAL